MEVTFLFFKILFDLGFGLATIFAVFEFCLLSSSISISLEVFRNFSLACSLLIVVEACDLSLGPSSAASY